ncbi:hypothetical protein [Bradyrhizobium algeriense]|uniref:hypothetical protein n=1 Tax=Bradyrhizobium algeriense TaxID=634784 RepID=UPI0011AE8306|nr:hypothetical protein [Bradyrhizobium algeriense]
MNALLILSALDFAESVRRACPDMTLNCHNYAKLGARKYHKPYCVDQDTGCASIATCLIFPVASLQVLCTSSAVAPTLILRSLASPPLRRLTEL